MNLKQTMFTTLRWVAWLLLGDHMKVFVLFCAICAFSLWSAYTGSRQFHINTWINPRIELGGYQFTKKPPDWVNFEEAYEIFLDNYCRESGAETTKTCQDEIAGAYGSYSKAVVRWFADRSRMIDKLDKEDRTLSDQCKKVGLGLFCGFDRVNDSSDADLSGTFMAGLNLDEARLGNSNLSNANLEATVATSADLSNSDLSFAQLERAVLDYADLNSANLQGAQLRGASALQTNLIDADLRDSDLTDICFDQANITGASFYGAKIQGGAFRHVEFTQSNSDILRAFFSIFGENPGIEIDLLDSAFGDGSVVFSGGITAPTHWPAERLSDDAFAARWRGWRESQGHAWPPPTLATHGGCGLGASSSQESPLNVESVQTSQAVSDEELYPFDAPEGCGWNLPSCQKDDWDAASRQNGLSRSDEYLHYAYIDHRHIDLADYDITAIRNSDWQDGGILVKIYQLNDDGSCIYRDHNYEDGEAGASTLRYQLQNGRYIVSVEGQTATGFDANLKITPATLIE